MVPCVFWFLSIVWPLLLLSPAQRRPGVCARCGYDLRGNVSGVCPECGTAIASRVPADPSDPSHSPAQQRAIPIAVAVAAAAIVAHLSFVAVHLRHILNPAGSPYGHENAFGDAGGWMPIWCLVVPAFLAGGSLILLTFAIIPGRPTGRSLRTVLATWLACAVTLTWLNIVGFWWFFD